MKRVGVLAVLAFAVAWAVFAARDMPAASIGLSSPAASTPALSFRSPVVADAEPTATPPRFSGGPIPDGYRIQIPRLAIDLPIAEGDLRRDIDEQMTPVGAAFHLPGTAVPGQNGNSFIYAHARSGMFLALWDVRLGDEVLIRAPDGRLLIYAVREILPRVAPSDVATTRPSASEQLTLQTSTGPNPADPRFVVVALPASQ